MRKHVCLITCGPGPHYVTGVEHCSTCCGGKTCKHLRATAGLADDLESKLLKKETDNGDTTTATSER